MSQDQKRDAIIEAALKRFAHFGVSKTTMSEISTDLAISKASLYYYFPDKINLYAAVLQSIVEDSQRNDTPVVEAEPDPFKAIQLFLERRTDFIIKYYNILEFLKSKTDIPKELQPLFNKVKERELQLIRHVVEKGCKTGVLNDNDAASKASLLFECLDGLRYVLLNQESAFFPDKKKFLAILKKEKQLSQIFLKGLAT